MRARVFRAILAGGAFCLLDCSLSGGALLDLLLFPEVLRKEGLEVSILHRVLALVAVQGDGRVASDHSSAPGLNDNSRLKLRHNFAISLREHGVRHEHIVIEALADTNLGGSLVLHGANGEGKRGEALVDLDEESASALHLQVVDGLELALEDGAAGLVLLRLALASGDVDVEAEDITGGELPLSDLLGASEAVDDDVVSVNNVALDLVGENALDGVALELLSDLLDNLSHAVVRGGLGNFALGSLEGVPGSADDISLAARDGSITDDDRGCRV